MYKYSSTTSGTSNQARRDAWYRKFLTAEWAGVLVNAILALFTYALFCLTSRQAEISESALKITENQFVVQHEPIIHFNTANFTKALPNDYLTVKMIFTNLGDYPAKFIDLKYKMVVSDSTYNNFDQIFLDIEKSELNILNMYLSREEPLTLRFSTDKLITTDEFLKLNSYQLFAYVSFKGTYLNLLTNKKKEMKFIVRFNRDNDAKMFVNEQEYVK